MKPQQAINLESVVWKCACALVPVFVCSLMGCSNQEMYEAIQSNRIAACQELVGRRYDDCLAQYEADYEAFKRERLEVAGRKQDQTG